MPPPLEMIYAQTTHEEPSPKLPSKFRGREEMKHPEVISPKFSRTEEIILLLEGFKVDRIEIDDVLERLSHYGLRYIEDEKNENI